MNIDLESLAKEVTDEHKNIVLVTCSKAYIDVLDNWLKFFYRVCHQKVLILSLDEETIEFCKKKNLNFIFIPTEEDLSLVWLKRAETIRDLMNAGYNVLSSDADAIWLRDPLPTLNNLDCDIIASAGNVQPLSVWEKIGCTICCGFYFLKGSEKNVTLFNMLIDIGENLISKKEYFSDQKNLNNLIFENFVNTSDNECYFYEHRGKQIKCSTTPFIFKSILKATELSIAILPHRSFPRVFQAEIKHQKEFIVVHPVSPRDGMDTLKALKAFGLIFPES